MDTSKEEIVNLRKQINRLKIIQKQFASYVWPPFCMYSDILGTLYIQDRRILLEPQEKAFDKVMKIL